MSIPARWSILLALTFLHCSSSNVNDEQASGGSGGDSGSVGGSAGSISGGASGQAGMAGMAGSDGGETCAGDALQCVTCCEANQPDGYAEFLEEFKISQCSGQACSGTCGAICSGSSDTVTQSCAECFFVNEPNLNTQVGFACKLSAQVECEAFASCLEACRLE